MSPGPSKGNLLESKIKLMPLFGLKISGYIFVGGI
jgi:hypothetical protein